MRSLIWISAAISALCVFFSCGRRGASVSELERVNTEISDSIKTGNYAMADSIINRHMSDARDSDEYYNFMVQSALLDYYASRPDSMTAKTRRALAYLNGAKPSQLRQHLLTKCYGALGASFVQYSYNEDSCIHYQKLALQSAMLEDDRREALQAMGNLADTYRLSGRLDNSCALYLRAIAMADSLKVPATDYVPLYGGLAGAYTSLYDFENSRKWWDKNRSLWDAMTPYEKFNYLNNTGNDFYLAKNYEASLRQFISLDSLLDRHPDWVWERRFCSANTTDVYLALEQADKAAEHIDENLHYFTVVQPNPYASEHIITQKMRLLEMQGHLDSVSALIAAHPIGRDMRPEQRILRLDFLRGFYTRTGQWQKGLDAERDYHLLDDSLRNERIKLSSHAMRLGYEHDSQMLQIKMEASRHKSRLTVWIFVAVVAVFVILLLIVAMAMRRHRNAMREANMLARIRELRLTDARKRVTPHFIYNALNHVLALRSKGEPDSLDTIVTLLRRQQLVASEILIPLASELGFIDSYVRIKSDSLQSEMRYDVNVSPDIDPASLMVPCMAIQIFVENAFKHGFPSLSDSDRRILLIDVIPDGDGMVRITVRNNSAPNATPSSDSTRQGLRIVDCTLQYLNEHNRKKSLLSTGMWTDNPQHGGFITTLIIPDNLHLSAKTK